MQLGKLDPNLLIKLSLMAGAGLGVLYLVHKTTGAAAEVLDQAVITIKTTLNPASDQNAIYKGVNAVGAAVTGDTSGSFTLGGWLYDITHNDPNSGH